MSTIRCRVLDMVKREKSQDVWGNRAERYDGMGDRVERLAIGDSRQWICRRAYGRTLEVAIGTGRNLPLYGPDVDLVGVDLSPGMLAVARRTASRLGRPVALHEAAAERLPFADASFDTVVCTLAICSVSSRDESIAEMYRVLRPGGRLLLIDHVERRWRSGRPADLAVHQGFAPESRERRRLGLIERLAARKPSG
jgi:ubiquinone/menaquinone biosynthesis C-methylase UbiE